MQRNATPFREPRVDFIRGPLVSLHRLQQIQQSVTKSIVLQKAGAAANTNGLQRRQVLSAVLEYRFRLIDISFQARLRLPQQGNASGEVGSSHRGSRPSRGVAVAGHCAPDADAWRRQVRLRPMTSIDDNRASTTEARDLVVGIRSPH